MPWCPKCKNEYREGITVCADCGCELVAEEPKEVKIPTTEEILNGNLSDEQKELRASLNASVYKKSADKAEDNKSSAWTLLVVGGIGMLAMLLGMAGLLPFRLGNPFMFYGVMSAVFIIFIIMGIVSMKNAKVYAEQAETENTLFETMKQWCEAHLKADEIDARLDVEAEDLQELSDEVLYFKRYEKLKEVLNDQFMNLDQDFLDNFLDEVVYDMVYGE